MHKPAVIKRTVKKKETDKLVLFKIHSIIGPVAPHSIDPKIISSIPLDLEKSFFIN